MKFIPKFGKKEYQEKQVAPVPEGQNASQSGTFINESQRQILVKIVDDGNPSALAIALGTLEIATDIVKRQLSEWHMKDNKHKTIITPAPIQNGGLHVQ